MFRNVGIQAFVVSGLDHEGEGLGFRGLGC